MQRMAAHFSGDICMALDRPIDGVEKVVAPATFDTSQTFLFGKMQRMAAHFREIFVWLSTGR